MSLDIWFVNILSTIVIVIAGWGVIMYLFPMLENMLKPAIKDKKALSAFMGLLNILILWIVAQGIINYLLKINNVYLNYLDIITPGLDLFLEFLPHLKWIILGWFLVLAFKKR